VAARRRAVVWADSATAGLDEVITFIAQDSRDAAIQVLERALDTAESLEALADRDRLDPERGGCDASRVQATTMAGRDDSLCERPSILERAGGRG